MKPNIQIEPKTKSRIAKWGVNKLFGNPDQRKESSQDELISLFDRIWKETLNAAVSKADVCDSQEANLRISNQEKKFFDFDQEHRQFRLKEHNLEFIAQLSPKPDNEFELTQLWKISSTDTNPKLLYITFDTVREREEFRELADELGWDDEALGFRLIQDFVEKFGRWQKTNADK